MKFFIKIFSKWWYMVTMATRSWLLNGISAGGDFSRSSHLFDLKSSGHVRIKLKSAMNQNLSNNFFLYKNMNPGSHMTKKMKKVTGGVNHNYPKSYQNCFILVHCTLQYNSNIPWKFEGKRDNTFWEIFASSGDTRNFDKKKEQSILVKTIILSQLVPRNHKKLNEIKISQHHKCLPQHFLKFLILWFSLIDLLVEYFVVL